MSAFVRGKDVMDSLAIPAFEFVRDYVLKGLTPHTDHGNPYRPAEVVYEFTAGLENELACQDELAWELTGPAREDYIAAHVQPLQDRLENYRNYLNCIQDYTWAEYGLPHDYELAATFIERLVNSLYLKEQVTRFLPWPVKPPQAPPPSTRHFKALKLTHSKKCKMQCRVIAKQLWEQNPMLSVAGMLRAPEIREHSRKLNGAPFSESTVRNWINCLCPNHLFGRSLRKAKAPNRSDTKLPPAHWRGSPP